jgi:hypothetical protein
MKKIFFLLSILTLIFASCQKDGSGLVNKDSQLALIQKNLPNAIGILDMVKQPTDGYLSISSVQSLYSQYEDNQDYGVYIDAKIFAPELLTQGSEAIKFNDYSVDFNSTRNQYSTLVSPSGVRNLYGNNIKISGGKNLNNFSTSFYCAKTIKLDLKPSPDGNTIKNGTVITWNRDENNNFGIGIALEFSPNSSKNLINGIKGNSTINKVIHTDDDGEYTITEADLANFPNHGELSVYVGRGNYSVVPVNNKKLGIYSYSVVYDYFTTVK